MAYRPHPKGAKVNPASPRAWATCDRSGFVNNHQDMVWQYDYAGMSLVNTNLLVRLKSLDKPNPQKMTVILPPDPVPIDSPRVEPYSIDEA